MKSNGEVVCWGGGPLNGNYGFLGHDSTADSETPVTVVSGEGKSDPLRNVVQVSLGYYHTCALLSGGGVRCWGLGDSGQLGNNSTGDRSAPVGVSSLNNATQISAGFAHTCALTSGGGVRCWGYGGGGRLGNGSWVSSSVPVTVVAGLGTTNSLGGVAQLSVGDRHSCVLLSGGGVRCWGSGGSGQLGNGSTSSSSVPVTVVSGVGKTDPLQNVQQVSAGGWAGGNSSTCALMKSGEVRCWGQGG